MHSLLQVSVAGAVLFSFGFIILHLQLHQGEKRNDRWSRRSMYPSYGTDLVQSFPAIRFGYSVTLPIRPRFQKWTTPKTSPHSTIIKTYDTRDVC